jgi:hypothetical protein
MERLREKRLQEFKENLNADEIKFSDDIAGRKAHFEEKVMGKV